MNSRTEEPSSNIIKRHKTSPQLEIFQNLIKHLPYYTLLLDENRRIIYANDCFLDDNSIDNINEVFDKRTGDIFQCENSLEAGCGNSNNCSFCGIYKTINECSFLKSPVSNKSKIIIQKEGMIAAYEFMVKCSPVIILKEQYFLLTLVNISAENRKLALEKIFFHDMMNLIHALSGVVQIMEGMNSHPEMKEYLKFQSEIIFRLTEMIATQKDLVNAEKNELIVNNRMVSAKEIILSVINNTSYYDKQNPQRIKIGEISRDVKICTDPVLLSRVLINMIKNAFEATNNLTDITISFRQIDGQARFSVHNHGTIQTETGRFIFQPMFSTKGDNRGLGTFSMRLIGENYLKGKVHFVSTPEKGTIFIIDIPIKKDSLIHSSNNL